MQNRLNELFKRLDLNDQTGCLVVNPSNVTYLSGFSGEAALLIVSPSGNVLMTDGRYDEQAREECGDHFQVTKWHNPKRPDPETLLFYMKQFKLNKLFFNETALTYGEYDQLKKCFSNHQSNIELFPMGNPIVRLREVKEPGEIASLRKACEISDLALKATIDMIKPGVTELEVVATLEYHMKMKGAQNISFDTIVLSGKKTSLPHGKPSDKVLEAGDFLQLDFGALYEGYHADMSRTFIIGHATEEQKSLYRLMLKATLEATDIIRDGIATKEADRVAREVIGPKYEAYYYPGLGHGVGLDVHEEPRLSQNAKDIFKRGQVVTVEPGVYIPNWGGMRIEDTILVTDEGYEVLTHFPRHLMILE